jgi:hypothetical protein
VGFVVKKVTLRNVFSEYFGFPCQSSFHRLLHTHLPFGAGAIDPLVAGVPSGLDLIPRHKLKKNNKIKNSEWSTGERGWEEEKKRGIRKR